MPLIITFLTAFFAAPIGADPPQIETLTVPSGLGLHAVHGRQSTTFVFQDAAGDLEATVSATSLFVVALGDARLEAAGALDATVTANALFVRAVGANRSSMCSTGVLPVPLG